MADAANKQYKEPFKIKKELRMLPGYLLIFIWLAFTVVLVGWIVLASLSTTKEIFTGNVLASGLHFENYSYAWTKGNMSGYFLNSILYSVVSVTGIILVAAPCAYALSRFSFFYNKALRTMIVTALSIPSVMVILPLYSLAVNLGILNNRITLMILYICLQVPFCAFFLLSFFATLSKTYEEAAAIDGCSPIATFFRIMFPLAQPGLITVGIFLFMGIWNEFFIATIFATEAKIRPLAVGLQNLVQSLSINGKWAELFAGVMIVFLPTFVLYVFLSEKIIAGVTGGGLKE